MKTDLFSVVKIKFDRYGFDGDVTVRIAESMDAARMIVDVEKRRVLIDNGIFSDDGGLLEKPSNLFSSSEEWSDAYDKGIVSLIIGEDNRTEWHMAKLSQTGSLGSDRIWSQKCVDEK